VKRDADFGVAFEATDTGPMSGAGVDNDYGRLGRIDAVVPALVANLGDTQQRIVGWALELSRVEKHLRFEIEERRKAQALMLEHGVCAFPQRIEEQDRAFEHVSLVREHIEGGHRCRLQIDRGG
jgi:hypothetical protein